MKLPLVLFLLGLILALPRGVADEQPLRVVVDTTEVPHLKDWGDSAKELVVRWHPRICNLLTTKGVSPPRRVSLKIQKSDTGVGATSGTSITVSSSWIEQHPDDYGLVLHELVHVVQAYPSGNPWWVTEGIADYLRWAIYEGKPQSWFPRSEDQRGYKKGYRVAAGFLLWLESDAAPGIVRKLNSAMRRGEYSADLFESETGYTLDELWAQYAGEK